MKPLEVWTYQRVEKLKKKSSKIQKNNYAATMGSAARRQISGGGGAPINKSRRRRPPQIVGGGGAARPAHGSSPIPILGLLLRHDMSAAATGYNCSPTLSPRLDLPGF